MIAESMAAAQLGQMIRRLYGRGYPIARTLFRRLGKKEHRRLQEKLSQMGTELTTTVQPGDVFVDVLPTRSIETPADWTRQGKRLELLQIKIAVNPREEIRPSSLTVRLEIQDPDVKFVDHFPRNQSEEVGTQEVEFSEEGKFVATAVDKANVGASVDVAGAKVSAGMSRSDSTEASASKAASKKLTFTPTVEKIQSYAVGDVAFWQLLASDRDAPVGGIDLFVSLLVDGEPRRAECSIGIDVMFEKWGPLRLDRVFAVDLS